MSIDVYVTSEIQKQSLSHIWRTSIQESVNGDEKRSALFTWPRISLDNKLCFVSYAERSFIRAALSYSLSGIWGFPFVHDKTVLTSEASSGQKVLTVAETDYRHFYDGRGCILVYSSNWEDYEFATIDTVDSATQITLKDNLSDTWIAGTKVYPIFEYRIAQSQEVQVTIRHLNYLKILASESFEDTRSFSYSLPSSDADTYKGLDVFLTRPLYPLTEPYRHPFTTLAFLGKGKIFDSYDRTRPGLSGSFIIVSKSNVQDVLNFFDSKRGRFQTFYMPSWDNDIVASAAIDSADQIVNVNFLYLPSSELVGRHLYIRFPGGSYVCKEITARPSTTSITLDSAIGTSVSAANLSKMLISYLYEVRFDIDEILVSYISDDIARIKLKFKVVW